MLQSMKASEYTELFVLREQNEGGKWLTTIFQKVQVADLVSLTNLLQV